MSEILSVFTRSILLFNKALFVNSPGSASLAPFFSNVLEILSITAKPPWQLISKRSSPVKEFGDLK